MVHVFTHVERPDRELIEVFKDLGVATVYEASGRKGFVDPRIKPLARGIRLLGPAFTVECHPKDNLMLHKALQIAQKGDVLVASTQGYPDAGYWGGLMATSAVARELAGLAIDGCVRDSAEITDMGFPVFCRDTCIRGTVKGTLGRVNHAIVFGGAVVEPGDLVLGDDDGIVIVARGEIEAVLKAAQERVAKEATKAAVLAKGISSVELNKLEPVFHSLGMVEK
jgi:4-hydroxy-4-methyl-2-oxoglutarate aldolase